MSELIRGIIILTGAITLFVIKNLVGAALIGVAAGFLAMLPATRRDRQRVALLEALGSIVAATAELDRVIDAVEKTKRTL